MDSACDTLRGLPIGNIAPRRPKNQLFCWQAVILTSTSNSVSPERNDAGTETEPSRSLVKFLNSVFHKIVRAIPYCSVATTFRVTLRRSTEPAPSLLIGKLGALGCDAIGGCPSLAAWKDSSLYRQKIAHLSWVFQTKWSPTKATSRCRPPRRS